MIALRIDDMRLAKVTGNVWSTIEADQLKEYKLMRVVSLDDAKEEYIATDILGAGIGETVVTVGGSSARATTACHGVPIDSTIIAIVDTAEKNTFG